MNAEGQMSEARRIIARAEEWAQQKAEQLPLHIGIRAGVLEQMLTDTYLEGYKRGSNDTAALIKEVRGRAI